MDLASSGKWQHRVHHAVIVLVRLAGNRGTALKMLISAKASDSASPWRRDSCENEWPKTEVLTQGSANNPKKDGVAVRSPSLVICAADDIFYVIGYVFSTVG